MINDMFLQMSFITIIQFNHSMLILLAPVLSQISQFRLTSKLEVAKEIVIYPSFMQFKLPYEGDVDF